MSKHSRGAELLKLVHFVKARIAELPPIVADDWSSHDARRAAAGALVEELRRSHNARYSKPLGGHRLTMAGVSTTCTSGHSGLLTNWVNAAYRKIDMERPS